MQMFKKILGKADGVQVMCKIVCFKFFKPILHLYLNKMSI